MREHQPDESQAKVERCRQKGRFMQPYCVRCNILRTSPGNVQDRDCRESSDESYSDWRHERASKHGLRTYIISWSSIVFSIDDENIIKGLAKRQYMVGIENVPTR